MVTKVLSWLTLGFQRYQVYQVHRHGNVLRSAPAPEAVMFGIKELKGGKKNSVANGSLENVILIHRGSQTWRHIRLLQHPPAVFVLQSIFTSEPFHRTSEARRGTDGGTGTLHWMHFYHLKVLLLMFYRVPLCLFAAARLESAVGRMNG